MVERWQSPYAIGKGMEEEACLYLSVRGGHEEQDERMMRVRS